MDSPLFAPWRMDYLRSLDKTPADTGCFLCAAAAANDDEQRRRATVLWRSQLCVVLMNKFPYNNGHLLIAPVAHKAELEDLSDAERCDLLSQTTQCVGLLRRAVSAQGFNIGINLGKCAGAGLPGHLHQHVVPRWAGDQNFMPIIGRTRTLPQLMTETRQLLADAWA